MLEYENQLSNTLRYIKYVASDLMHTPILSSLMKIEKENIFKTYSHSWILKVKPII